MKNVKKLLAMALALVLVMALATTAFAADVTNSTPGHTYDAYQVFKGTQADNDPALAQIDWGTTIILIPAPRLQMLPRSWRARLTSALKPTPWLRLLTTI